MGENDDTVPVLLRAAANEAESPKGTMPVDPRRRIPESDIRIELCSPSDVDVIASGFQAIFGSAFWDIIEPHAIRDGNLETRRKRLATRISPMFNDLPGMNTKWIKAIYVPTGQIVGAAGWCLPGMPIHNPWRRSAEAFYDFKSKMGWTDADIEEMWRGVSIEALDGQGAFNDKTRAQIMGEEPHWFLAPLMTWPEFRGRGVATKLMNWAIEQADRADPVQPMYLKSTPEAREMYIRFGFKPEGETTLVRRGPA